MTKIKAGDPMDLITMSKASAPIGEIKQSLLGELEFNEENLGIWYPLDGRSCVGTSYQTVSGNSNVPDAVTQGTFLRQAKAGRQLGSYEADNNKAHSHGTGKIGWGAGPYDAGSGRTDANSPANSWIHNTDSSGGAEARPKNLAVNFYIKVEY